MSQELSKTGFNHKYKYKYIATKMDYAQTSIYNICTCIDSLLHSLSLPH